MSCAWRVLKTFSGGSMSERIYAWLLQVLAPRFQQAYGQEAQQLFRDRSRDEQGFAAQLRLWADLLAGLAVCVTREPRWAHQAAARPPRRALDGLPLFHIVEGGGTPTCSRPVPGSALFVRCSRCPPAPDQPRWLSPISTDCHRLVLRSPAKHCRDHVPAVRKANRTAEPSSFQTRRCAD